MESIIRLTKEFLWNTLNASTNIDDIEKKYRYEHSLRVSHIGKQISKVEGADTLIVEIGCLLHDVGKFQTEVNRDHGRVSAMVAKVFLETLNLSNKQIDDICYAIAVHVDGEAGYLYEETLESKIVTDSDNIDRFGAYRIYQSLDWDNIKQMKIEEAYEKISNRIKRLEKLVEEYDLETTEGTRLFKDNIKFQIQFYNRYLLELENTLIELNY